MKNMTLVFFGKKQKMIAVFEDISGVINDHDRGSVIILKNGAQKYVDQSFEEVKKVMIGVIQGDFT